MIYHAFYFVHFAQSQLPIDYSSSFVNPTAEISHYIASSTQTVFF